MLKLKNITKDYVSKDLPTVHALKGVSVNFRRNEFVAILGQSGCGKTTLLNIVGGLDRYTDGDLSINGKSTKNYNDRDWDTYRNHSIGFIFQSYNLISHITILANVELALTISGISKTERRKRALEALKTVGLEGMEKKKPNQLSGGQMQRVAIARALVNNPEILLADEPTGALDSETSIQVMDLLKEVAASRLVIMVTHNQELAHNYANRIIGMKDGVLTSDTNPYDGESDEERKEAISKLNIPSKGSKKRTSMSFKTSLGLSLTNLLTKKGRTFLTAFAGSIGIIGIALVMSVSYGFNEYIKQIQADALTSYPMTINRSSIDTSALLSGVLGSSDNGEKYPNSNVVGSNDSLTDLISSFALSMGVNNTKGFKSYIERNDVREEYGEYITSVQYSYQMGLNVYSNNNNPRQIYPVDLTYGNYEDPRLLQEVKDTARLLNAVVSPTMFPIYSELIPNYDYNRYPNQEYSNILNDQYDVQYGRMPKEYNEIVIVVDEYNRIDDFMLFGLGLKSPQFMMEELVRATNPSFEFEGVEDEQFSMTYEQLCDLSFKMPLSFELYDFVLDTDISDGTTSYFSKKTGQDLTNSIKNSLELDVVGILRPKKNITSSSISGAVGYLPSLTEYIINEINNPSNSEYDNIFTNVVMYQKLNPLVDALSGKIYNPLDQNQLLESITMYSNNLKALGVRDLEDPTSIYIYPKDFVAKAKINEMVSKFNKEMEDSVRAENPNLTEEELSTLIASSQVKVSDTVGSLMTSVQVIVDSVSYVLIAFISISLVVSSIMIGIITYVSVLERTKEIGVLRSIGARKLDVSNVFNAETLLIGLTAGIIGVSLALLIDIPIAIIIEALTGVALSIVVPWYAMIILPLISIFLTTFSGLVPARIAAKKDPVIALRSE